jgi:uncharacterized protein (DUF2147 family)
MNFLKASRVMIAVLFLGNVAGAAFAGQVWNQDDVVGLWWSPKKDAKIKIYRKDGKFYGKLAWMLPKDRDKTDIKNPDPKKRNNKLLGSKIFFDLKFDGKDTWKDGRLYDPQRGGFFDGYLKLENKDVLEVNGFILIPLFGGGEKLKRVGSEEQGAKLK